MEEKNYFEALNKLDLSNKVEKKGRFGYISWSDAVETLLLHDPKAIWQFHDVQWFGKEGNQTAMVSCTVTAFNKPVFMHLAVINSGNKPIVNPTSADIANSMMRCLTKAIACHGVGLYVYRGEDLPNDEKPQQQPKPIQAQQQSQQEDGFHLYVVNAIKAKLINPDVLNRFLTQYKVDRPSELPQIERQKIVKIIEGAKAAKKQS